VLAFFGLAVHSMPGQPSTAWSTAAMTSFGAALLAALTPQVQFRSRPRPPSTSIWQQPSTTAHPTIPSAFAQHSTFSRHLLLFLHPSPLCSARSPTRGDFEYRSVRPIQLTFRLRRALSRTMAGRKWSRLDQIISRTSTDTLQARFLPCSP
jgi:hypothetical protein